MTTDSISVQELLRKADALMTSERGYSREGKPGYLKLSNGAWRDPEIHVEIIKHLTDAFKKDQPPFLSLYRRGATQMVAGLVDDALSDLRLLEALGSRYADGIFPLQLFLLRGEKEHAQKYLDQINAANKAKGAPKQKFCDFL